MDGQFRTPASADQEGLATVWGYTGMTSAPVTLFWRPGCLYCRRLRTKLKRAGVHVDEINIWEDPAGAAFVRSVTGGDETVPTVRVGTRSFVNPSPRHLLEIIREFRLDGTRFPEDSADE